MHTLGDSLLGVVVLVGREEAGRYAWGQWSSSLPLGVPHREDFLSEM